jgi:hypothetical protein
MRDSELSIPPSPADWALQQCLVQVAPYLDTAETQSAHAFVSGMGALLELRGVTLTPTLIMRIEDVVHSHILVGRLEMDIWQKGVVFTPPVPEEDEQNTTSRRRTASQKEYINPAVEALGKARERLRKAMKELEDNCGTVAAPTQRNLAEEVLPLLKKGEGVMAEVLEESQAEQALLKTLPGGPLRDPVKSETEDS